jgi:hypothetical protein
MTRTQQKQKLAAAARRARGNTLLARLAKQIDSPQRVAELHYWSQEPGLLETIRAIVAMPQASRAALATFLDIAGDPQSVVANVDGQGNLTFTSPNIAEALAEVVNANHEKCIELAPDVAQRIH